MKKYLLFDLDGTLTDTGPGIMGSVQDALSRLGWPEQSRDFLRRFVGPPLEESFRDFCGMDGDGVEEAIRLYRERYNAWGVFQSPLYPGVDAMLKKLSSKAVLCVATSKREQGARKILGMRGIEGLFRVVVGDDGTRPTKSHVIGEVLAQMGNPPRGQVLMVGDRSYDVAGAKAQGVETAGAVYGYGTRDELETAGGDYLAESVEELEALCLGLI